MKSWLRLAASVRAPTRRRRLLLLRRLRPRRPRRATAAPSPSASSRSPVRSSSPPGATCRNFNELALACQEDWARARDLLKQGYLESFLGGLGRVDLALAAKEAARFPDHDRGLDQFLAKLPSRRARRPEAERRAAGSQPRRPRTSATERQFDLHLENQGMRLLYGTVDLPDGVWLTLGDAPGTREKHFQFSHELALPSTFVGDQPARRQQAARGQLVDRVQRRHADGRWSAPRCRSSRSRRACWPAPRARARSPRRPRPTPRRRAPLFESGAVASWYKDNGWTYPVQGPAASGLGAVQQFFEALGLTPAAQGGHQPTQSIDLAGNPGEPLRYSHRGQDARRNGPSTPTPPATSPGWKWAGPSSTAASPPSTCRSRRCPTGPARR